MAFRENGEQVSLAAIDDQLANAREQALAQGMTADQAEAHARSVVLGNDPAIGEHYDLLKAQHAESLAKQDLQGSAQAQTDAANDAMMGRIQQSQLIAADEAQAAEAEARQARDASFLPTNLRPGYEQQKQAVNELMQRRVEEKEAVDAAQIISDLGDPNRVMGPGGWEIDSGGERRLPQGEDAYSTFLQYEDPTTNVAQVAQFEQEAAAKAQAEAQAAAEQEKLQAEVERQQEEKIREQEKLDRERAAESRERQMQGLALQYMMSQQVGPATIGEARTGKYGTRQAQMTSDINALRTFFGERGKMQRGKMKEQEAQKKMERFEKTHRRLTSQSKARVKARRDIAGEREKTRTQVAEANRVSRELIAANKLDLWEERMEQNSGLVQARVNLAWSQNELARMGTNKAGRNILEIQANAFRGDARVSQAQGRRHDEEVRRLSKEIARVQGEMDWSKRYSQSDLQALEYKRDAAESARDAAYNEAGDYQKASARATKALGKYRLAPRKGKNSASVTAKGLMR